MKSVFLDFIISRLAAVIVYGQLYKLVHLKEDILFYIFFSKIIKISLFVVDLDAIFSVIKCSIA